MREQRKADTGKERTRVDLGYGQEQMDTELVDGDTGNVGKDDKESVSVKMDKDRKDKKTKDKHRHEEF